MNYGFHGRAVNQDVVASTGIRRVEETHEVHEFTFVM
jgi:hypothetical protein